MKKIVNIFIAVAVVATIVSCNVSLKDSDAVGDYVIFADTLSTNAVESNGKPFKVSISATSVQKYDRTYAVEVIDKGSNAIEGYHYRLKSNTFTIPAGKLAADIEVYGNYENILPNDSLGFTLQLVIPEEMKWDLYSEHNRTKVTMFKSCPFDINEWGGTEQEPRYCLLTSLLLYSYPGTNTSYSRLVKCYKHKSLENTIIMDDLFYNGYDVLISFDVSNPSEPLIKMEGEQIIGSEYTVFGQQLGDGKILGTTSTRELSSFNSCQKFAQLWVHMFVKDFSTTIGTVGHFYNIMEWISEDEAEEIMREGL